MRYLRRLKRGALRYSLVLMTTDAAMCRKGMNPTRGK
jgi:hypothetical protein